MFLRVVFAAFVAAAPLVAQQEDRPKVPKDSVFVSVTGCLKGRVLRAADVREPDVREPDTISGLNIRNHSFRLAGKKDVMNAVKKDDGHRVEVTGLIKKSALIEPGIKFRGGRVVVGRGTMGSGSPSAIPDPADNVVVLDVSTIRAVGGSCG